MRSRVRGRGAFRSGVLSALFLGAPAVSLAAPPVVPPPSEVVVTNDLNETIYGLYLWPSDLVPRTYTLLNGPLLPNRQVTVRIDNVYGDCEFTFRADLTAPKSRRKVLVRQYRKPRPRNVYVYNINICGRKDPVNIADPVGSNFGP